MEPDFYIPYQGGYLPMRVVQLNVAHEGGAPVGPQEVRMTIEAVSVGAPVRNVPTSREVAGAMPALEQAE